MPVISSVSSAALRLPNWRFGNETQMLPATLNFLLQFLNSFACRFNSLPPSPLFTLLLILVAVSGALSSSCH